MDPVDEADEVVDRRLGAAAAHLAEEPVVCDEEERAARLTQVHVQLARRLPAHTDMTVLVVLLPQDPVSGFGDKIGLIFKRC